ncbi:MAG: AmmeMemoRadiSam system protein A [Planctomycetota bacterium]
MNAVRPSFSGLLPHPPIIVPDVGGARLAECQETVDACREFARRLALSQADRLLLISPHAPRADRAFGFFSGSRLTGDLGRFGAKQASVSLPNDLELARRIRESAERWQVATFEIGDEELDHGSVVPLCFLVEAGFTRPTCVMSLPMRCDVDGLVRFGKVLREALAGLGGRPALIASGDMSHGATPSGPAGFCRRGVEFDHALRDLLAAGRLDRLSSLDQDLRRDACEDAFHSTLAVAAALDFEASGPAVLSYEHPFGVGYLVSVFHDGSGVESSELDLLPGLAREAIRAKLQGTEFRLPAAKGALARSAPLFVTLRTARGQLRGCMGSLRPQEDNLVLETVERAKVAAFEDPRFSPVTREELAELTLEISVLGPLEAITSEDELDPMRFGVVVTDDHCRRGVLLPGVEGVATVEDQLAIARRKAGIQEGAEVRIERFEVIKLKEGARNRA